MRFPWVALALVACGDTRTRGAPEPTPKGSGTVPAPAFSVDCNTAHAPKPDRDPAPMCRVPAGDFTMGTPVESDRPQDGPARRVRISMPFYLDQLEVTSTQYAKFLRASGDGCGKAERYCFAGDQPEEIDVRADGFPVNAGYEQLPVQVTVRGAEAYCAWAGKRLPTEAEWELAARHDPATGNDRVYPWGDEYREGVTNIFGVIRPKRGTPAPVGSFRDDRSPVGVLDMGGNSSEWVADCYSLDFSCGNPCVDPVHTSRCEQVCYEGSSIDCWPGRVVRGGHAGSKVKYLTSKRRSGVVPHSSNGIRCARNAS